MCTVIMAAGAVGAAPLQIRVATYNASLNRNSAGQLPNDLATPNNAQAKRVAEIIQRVAPDVILINEFDYDAGGLSLQRFHDNYLSQSQNLQTALSFPHRFAAPSNTGVNPKTEVGTGYDFDNNGQVITTPGSESYGNDCYGFGVFPGQYGMAVYSRLPIDSTSARTFQKFLWKDMPDAVLPDRTTTPEPSDWYDAAERSVFRLSSKSHWDVPITLKSGQTFHLLASHPTPPVFDGAEDRNGRRNHDEIRFWAEYISGAAWIYDDPRAAGDSPDYGGLGAQERFVILGDQNADPVKGDSFNHAINQVLQHPLVNGMFTPTSPGGGTDTAAFASGRLRVDHVLPSRAGFSIVGGGVFWPLAGQPGASLISASDHRLVWIDLIAMPLIELAVKELAATPLGNDVTLTWTIQDGIDYAVERSDDLVIWTDLTADFLKIDPVTKIATAVDSGGAANSPGFYRVAARIEAP
ncbi:MAG: endonuclease/exonuclease/phosphatase family protein [Verrucomicrobiales bacterium]